MSTEIIAGKTFVEESYPIVDIGGGVISKGQAVRHFEKKHPEYTVVAISSFKIDHQTETIEVRVQVKKKAVVLPDDNQKPVVLNHACATNAIKHAQKLLNPGCNELLVSRNRLVDELAESEKQLSAANKQLKDALYLLSVSEYCKKYNYQNCSCCENRDCCDNTNPLVAELIAAEKQLLELQKVHELRGEVYLALEKAYKELEAELDELKKRNLALAEIAGVDISPEAPDVQLCVKDECDPDVACEGDCASCDDGSPDLPDTDTNVFNEAVAKGCDQADVIGPDDGPFSESAPTAEEVAAAAKEIITEADKMATEAIADAKRIELLKKSEEYPGQYQV